MGQRQVPARDTALAGDPLGFSGKPEGRLAAGQAHDLDVAPSDPMSKAGPQDLQNRLLGGKPGRQVLREPLGTAAGVGHLLEGEATPKKTLPVPLDELAEALNVDDVDAVAHDGHGDIISPATARP